MAKDSLSTKIDQVFAAYQKLEKEQQTLLATVKAKESRIRVLERERDTIKEDIDRIIAWMDENYANYRKENTDTQS